MSNARPSLSRIASLVLLLVLLVANTSVTSAQGTNTNESPAQTQQAAGNTNNQAAANPAATPLADDWRRSELMRKWWFSVLVSLLFASVLVPFAWTIIRIIRFSKSSFNSPLGLPEGSLRAMLAFMLVTFLGFYVLAGILSMSDLKPPEFMIGIVATVIGFYFGSRSGETAGPGAQTGSVDGKVTDANGATAPGATIALSQGGVQKFSQAADDQGQYILRNIPVGTYDIEATLVGHNPSAAASVTITSGAKQTISLQLT